MTADRALPAALQPDEMVETYAAGRWHPLRVICEDGDQVRVQWLSQSHGGTGKVKGAIYWLPRHDVHRPGEPR